MGRRLIHKKGIPSTMLAAIAAVLARIALVVVASGNPAIAASSLVNGNFEMGDLSGWSVDTTNGVVVEFCELRLDGILRSSL